MRFNNVCIESMGHVLPPNVVLSTDLEDQMQPVMKRLGFPRGMIEKLTGVRERRWWDPNTQPSQAAALAGERALEAAGISPSLVQVNVNGSVSRDYLEPATATLVGGNLGLGRHCMNLDVNNACLGFLNGMLVVANMIELGQVDYGLVTAAEITRDGVQATMQRMMDSNVNADEFRQNFASFTLGSAAVATVLCRKELSRSQHVLKGAAFRSATEYNYLCVANHVEMRADAHGLLHHGVDCAVDTWPYAAEVMGWQDDSVDEVVFHQVGMAHFAKTFNRLGLPMEKALVTFPFLGNTGPVSVPVTVAIGEAQGRITKGKEVAMFGVGSGLGSIILGVQW